MGIDELLARTALASACAYEVVAIASRRLPTITALNKRSGGVLGATIIGGLAWHFVKHDQ